MPTPPATFTTPRLHARRPTSSDAAAVFSAYAADPEVTRYLAWKPHKDVASLAEFLATRIKPWETGIGSEFAWLLRLHGNEEVIGSIEAGFDGPGRVMIGYVLARPYWGKGLMTEAANWLVNWAFAQPGIVRVWACCDTENPASTRVLEKAGLQREALIQHWLVCPTISPTPRDCFFYAKVK